MKPTYLMNLLVSLDQLGNAILGGDPDETISARSHYRRLAGSKKWSIAERVIDSIFYWDRKTTEKGRVIKHCELAFLMELRRRSEDLIRHRFQTYRELIRDITDGVVE